MSDDQQPLVSILIRSMDRPTLQRALDSAAAQTWANIELVVIAACGSTHRALPDTWKERPLRLVYPQPDRRLPRAEAANLCLESARGEWLNFLDDDDELLPNHVQTLLSAPRPTDVRLLYSRARVDDTDGKLSGYSGTTGRHVQLYYQSRSTPCATMIHRSLIDEGARFDPAFRICEDHDFYVNCASRTEFQFVDAITCIWNAYAGESGCGFGANENRTERDIYLDKLREKWRPLFNRWLADSDALMFIGQQYLRSGQVDDAVRCLERLLQLRPDDVNALNLCGMANLRHGDHARADELMRRALDILPQHGGLQENLRLIRAQSVEKA